MYSSPSVLARRGPKSEMRHVTFGPSQYFVAASAVGGLPAPAMTVTSATDSPTNPNIFIFPSRLCFLEKKSVRSNPTGRKSTNGCAGLRRGGRIAERIRLASRGRHGACQCLRSARCGQSISTQQYPRPGRPRSSFNIEMQVTDRARFFRIHHPPGVCTADRSAFIMTLYRYGQSTACPASRYGGDRKSNNNPLSGRPSPSRGSWGGRRRRLLLPPCIPGQ